MNSNPTSAVSGKGRTERSSKPVQRRIVRVRSLLNKLASFSVVYLDKVPVLGTFLRLRVVWALMIFFVGVAAGFTWGAYSTVKGGTSSQRLKAMSLALSAARQNLDKAANEMSKLDARGLDVPQRRSAR